MSAKPGVWVEFLSDEDVTAALPEIAPQLSRLHLSLPVERIREASFAKLTRAAQERGLAVYVWLLFSIEDGYWLGEHNAAKLQPIIADLLRWRDAPGGPVFDGVSFDLEPGHDYAEKLRKCRATQLPRLLAQHVDPVAFEEARKHFGSAIEQLHRKGVSAHATAFPLILDDAEGRAMFEDALDTPVSNLDWDEVSFMVYQTAFAQLAGLWFGPSLVASYAQSAVQRFGDRAGMDLGVVGAPALGLDAGDRYPDASALAADLAAAHSAGIPYERMRVYGLAGLLKEGGTAHWLAQLPAAKEPEMARETTGLRAALATLGRVG